MQPCIQNYHIMENGGVLFPAKRKNLSDSEAGLVERFEPSSSDAKCSGLNPVPRFLKTRNYGRFAPSAARIRLRGDILAII